MNVGRRVEVAVGGLNAYYAASKGVKNINPLNFMPNEAEPVQEVSLEEQLIMQFGDG